MGHEITSGLSFDDVLLVPQQSEILPAEAQLATQVTAGIGLNIPILSSAMDTVTEDRLAIALAREGGMGVIHRNNTIAEQVKMVRRVKRSENIVVENPQTIQPDTTIADLVQLMAEKGVSGFPVVDPEGLLVGMVTRRDVWVIENEHAPVSTVMTPRDRLVTGEPGYGLDDARSILYQHRIEKLPLVDGEGKLVGLMTGADIEKSTMFGNAAKDEDGHLFSGAAIGVGPDCYDRAEALLEAGADALFIDAATGHTRTAMTVLEKVRERFTHAVVVAGNVVTEQGAADLIAAGAAAVKVGVGPGSICTTRVISGVGVPQFTAILEASKACRPKGVPLIADGGIRYSGDAVKALAAGADCIMLGSMLAGTEESPGNKILWQGREYKEYRGMGSEGAMRKGSGDRYGQNASGKLVPEGVEARVPFKGPLNQTVFQLVGGIRSGMGYVGAPDLDTLRERARFVQITVGGLKESHPHDIVITRESTNYSSGV